MNMDDIRATMIATLASYQDLDGDQEEIDLTLTYTELGLDELDIVELILDMEEEYYISIPDSYQDETSTPAKLVEYIYNTKEEK